METAQTARSISTSPQNGNAFSSQQKSLLSAKFKSRFELAVGIAGTSFLGIFAPPADFSLLPSLEIANARGTFPGSLNSIKCRNFSHDSSTIVPMLGSSAFCFHCLYLSLLLYLLFKKL
ncbi:hypothetical protein DdX_18309 [Ditylenchus destructor]|uniref:Uncharacterized protein n=1 Tax=Ditylenchus destructor TaxID=166010 RepID=A0AAD4MKG9_9BILA|nr:hypothetical protein DdX_18309 [Ditylenchus destructor]